MGQRPELTRLIRKGESETVEFKRSFGREAIETLCAFANTAGGVVLIGVDDDGAVKGVPAAQNVLRDWSNQICQGSRGLHPSLETIMVQGKTMVCIQVEESRIKPVMCHGRAFMRSGSTTRQMSVEEMSRLVLANAGVTWDAVAEERATLADISMPKVRVFMEAARRAKRRSIPVGASPRELLEKLELMIGGKPTRAAILLFGVNPQRFYSQAKLKIGRFRGETLIVDDRRIEGTLFHQVEEAIAYFREKLDTRFEMTGRPQRDVVWEYPLKALREAVINAVCHREYMSPRDTEVRIYDNELIVWNDGGLPPTLSIQALRKQHASMPRNRQIAEIFYYAGLIEAWGGGTRMIFDECAASGLPEPPKHSPRPPQVTPHHPPSSSSRFSTYPPTIPQVPPKYPSNIPQAVDRLRLLEFCLEPRTIKEMLDVMRLRDRKSFMAQHLRPLLKDGGLAMTDPSFPNNPRQRYVTTQKGRGFLALAGTFFALNRMECEERGLAMRPDEEKSAKGEL